MSGSAQDGRSMFLKTQHAECINKAVASCVWLLDFADCYIKDDITKLDWKGHQVHFDKFKKLLGLKVVKALCTLNALTSCLYSIIVKGVYRNFNQVMSDY